MVSAQLPANLAPQGGDFAYARSEELAALLLDSHRALTGRTLLPPALTPTNAAVALYQAPFVVLAHDLSEDPRFIYANEAAQRRFVLALPEIIGMPSRFSAEPVAREERQWLLDRVATRGFIDDYRGVRIDSGGRRFEIRQATVWNLIDPSGKVVGQAAAFADWVDLPGSGA